MLASLRLTIALLAASFILVFVGTILQVESGIYWATQTVFQAWFLWWGPIPVFLGGYSLGVLLLINLAASYIKRFSVSRPGSFLMHGGLVVLIVGESLTGLYAEESQMQLPLGSIQNYSVSTRKSELVFEDSSHPDYTEVCCYDVSDLAKGQTLTAFGKSYEVLDVFANSKQENGLITSLPPVTKDTERNQPAVILSSEGMVLSGSCRPKRFYTEASLQLERFVHEKYPGSNIPKAFESHIRLLGPEGNVLREAKIEMNFPLRFEGRTYYQAATANQDTVSILQVVENRTAFVPYLACAITAFGMLWHFLAKLRRAA